MMSVDVEALVETVVVAVVAEALQPVIVMQTVEVMVLTVDEEMVPVTKKEVDSVTVSEQLVTAELAVQEEEDVLDWLAVEVGLLWDWDGELLG